MTNTRLLFVHALSPIHAGTGQSTGAIDLAIARDRATEHPCIPGSTLKGCFRDRAKTQKNKDTDAIFGPDTANASDHAGSLAFGDANLLLLPARSVAGTFAWVTSPFLLARFTRDAKEAGISKLPDIPVDLAMSACANTTQSMLRVTVGNNQRVIFEDLDLAASPAGSLSTTADRWADEISKRLFKDDAFWKNQLEKKLCIIHDDVMTFLARHATEVVTRVSIDENSKTVKQGQLWTEENLPTETILYSLLAAMPNGHTKKDANGIFSVLQELAKTPLQMGGNATVGRGRCRLVLTGGN
jgi:CRISPR-associated protein Cmr4